MPTDDGEFVLDTEASDFAIGADLSQKQGEHERVVAYASRRLDRRERNYCITRKELLAVVYFVRYFRQYLLGRQFKIRTDHAALTWLRRTPEPIGQQARWLEILEEFCFSIEHRSASRYGNADALSRRDCKTRDYACHATCKDGEVEGQDMKEDCCSVSGEVNVVKRRKGRLTMRDDAEVEGLPVADFVGGAADQPSGNVHSAPNADGETTRNVKAQDRAMNNFEWSIESLKKEQEIDQDINLIVQLMKKDSVVTEDGRHGYSFK